MSDQLFIGVDPKGEEGREYFFYCSDYLYPVCNLIATYCNTEWVPIPLLDESDCVQLSECLDKLVKKKVLQKRFFGKMRSTGRCHGRRQNRMSKHCWRTSPDFLYF